MTLPIYRITWTRIKGRFYAIFRSYPITESKNKVNKNSRDYIDVKVSAKNQEELLYLAQKLGCEISDENNWISTDNGDTYNKLIVYMVVRRSLRLPWKHEHLRELILTEDFTGDSWWWASTFTDIYQKKSGEFGVGSRCLYRPAKAFKFLYELAQR